MRSNDEIIAVLTDLKDRQGISISELARNVGMAKSALSRYFNRTREFPLNKVDDFAKVLHTSPEYILGFGKYDVATNIKRPTGIKKIPVLGAIACGDPITAEENIEEYRDTVADLLPSGNLFYLKAKGESMSPTIPNGAYVLIREQPNVEDGEIAAVLVDNDSEATLKRVKRQQGLVMLMPDNPEYNPIVLSKEYTGRIIGKAIKFTTVL